MVVKNLKEISNDLTQIPFIKEGKTYKLNIDYISKIINDLYIKQSSITDINSKIDEYILHLLNIEFSESEVNTYLRKGIRSKQLEEYEKRKKIIQKYICLYHKHDKTDLMVNILNAERPNNITPNGRKTDKKLVLNKANPFADVTITNQDFLYYDNGFKQLSFSTGYEIDTMEYNEEIISIMKPSFTIKKQDEVKKPEPNINFDKVTFEVTDKTEIDIVHL